VKTHTHRKMKLNRIAGYKPPITIAREDDEDFPETTVLESKVAGSNFLLLIMTDPAFAGMRETDLRRITELRAKRVRFLTLRLDLLKAISEGRKTLPEKEQAEYAAIVHDLTTAQAANPYVWAQSTPPPSAGLRALPTLSSERQMHDAINREAEEVEA